MIDLGQQRGKYLALAANIEVDSSYKCVFFACQLWQWTLPNAINWQSHPIVGTSPSCSDFGVFNSGSLGLTKPPQRLRVLCYKAKHVCVTGISVKILF